MNGVSTIPVILMLPGLVNYFYRADLIRVLKILTSAIQHVEMVKGETVILYTNIERIILVSVY